MRTLSLCVLLGLALQGLAQPTTCSNTVATVANDYSPSPVTKSILDFGAVPNDHCNDQAAFEAAAAFFQARNGNGTLTFPAGEFILGRQHTDPGQYLVGVTSLDFSNCEDLHLQGAAPVNGQPTTKFRLDDCLRYGTFDPTTGQRRLAPCAGTNNGDGAYLANLGSMVQFYRCRNIIVSDMEMNGNVDNLTLGGKYGDAGIQASATGITISNSIGVTVIDCNIHHMGWDGVLILAMPGQMLDGNNAAMNIELHDSRMEYCSRDGLTLGGGTGLSAFNCHFDNNGQVKLLTALYGVGVEIEEYDNNDFLPTQQNYFEGCTFIHNNSWGLLAGTHGHVRDHHFVGCTFVSGEHGVAMQPQAMQMLFTACHIHGSVQNCYSLPVGDPLIDRTVFQTCDFHDDYQGEFITSGQFMVNLNNANGVLLDECAFYNSWGLHGFWLHASPDQPATILDCIWNFSGRDTWWLMGSFSMDGGVVVQGDFVVNYPNNLISGLPWYYQMPSRPPGTTANMEGPGNDEPVPLPVHLDPVIERQAMCHSDPGVVLEPVQGCSTTQWSMTTVTDGAGGETTWEIIDQSNGLTVASGGPYPSNATSTEYFNLPIGCFNLLVHDAGNNGITGGGYVLRDYNGDPQIDNTNNGGTFTNLSQSPSGFCNPVGPNHLRDFDCGNLQRIAHDWIQSTVDPLVSAQWQVGDQTDDGYDFWFTDPNGSYNMIRQRRHSNPGGGFVASATRSSKLYLDSWTTNPCPQHMLLNVRVRKMVNGVLDAYGPACRIEVDPEAAYCPSIQLSAANCGVVNLHRNGSSGISAAPAIRQPGSVAANRYKFHFEIVGEGISFDIVQASYPMQILPSMPFVNGATYSVTVQASFDGGVTYCPVGATCYISFSPTGLDEQPDANAATLQEAPEISVVPNPNNGDHFLLFTQHVDLSRAFTLEVMDMFGRQVRSLSFAGQEDRSLVDVDMGEQLASGMYLVSLISEEQRHTQRVIVQH